MCLMHSSRNVLLKLQSTVNNNTKITHMLDLIDMVCKRLQVELHIRPPDVRDGDSQSGVRSKLADLTSVLPATC